MDGLVLRQNIPDELEFDPKADPAEIGVVAHGGIVMLTCHVGTYAGKDAAEMAV